MFDRFTDRAKKVMSFARLAAIRLQHNGIGTEHILLGIAEEGSGVAANVLKNRQLEPDTVRGAVHKMVKAGSAAVPSNAQLPFTPQAKRVLELALEEASQFHHNYIGTEHLLLGLMRETTGVSARVLQQLGLDLAATRKDVLEFIGESPELGDDAADPKVDLQSIMLETMRLTALLTMKGRAPAAPPGTAGAIVPGLAFVMIPTGTSFDSLLQQIIAPTLHHAGFGNVRASTGTDEPSMPIGDLMQRAELLLAVLTNQDPLVLYQLGQCHALGRHAILLIEQGQPIPPHLKALHPIVYETSTDGFTRLKQQITLPAVLLKTKNKPPDRQ